MKMGFLILTVLFLQGCATVVRLPSSTRQTPIVSGTLWGGRVGGDLASSVPVTVVNNAASNPPSRTEIRVGEADDFDVFQIFSMMSSSGIDFALGVAPFIDLYYTNNPGVRVNLTGDQKEGWLATVFAGYFSETSNHPVTGAKSTITKMGPEYGISIGNRFNGSKLFYLTLANRSGKADINITNDSGTKYLYNDSYDHYMGSLGFMFGFSWYGKFEVSCAYVNWRGRSDQLSQEIAGASTRGGFSAGFGFQW